MSVFKAVYIDQRELKCACVGGANSVPLGLCVANGKPDDDRHGAVDVVRPRLVLAGDSQTVLSAL